MKVLAISPTYNEKKNISELINRISKLPIDIDLLIIDDNSPDGTADIIKTIMSENKSIHLLEREKKLGLGTAYCEGFQWALERGYDLIVQIDADLSHNPDDLIQFPIKDSTGGFKCFQRKVLESIDFKMINSQGYSFQIEINFLAWIKGFKIKEIPIVFTDRTVGESKMNRGIVIEAIWMVPKLLIRKIFKIY